MGIAEILIDGYNVIGIFHRDMNNARREFIKQLTRYSRIKGHKITVVFDGHGGIAKNDTVKKEGGITVIYSAVNKKADDVIKEILQKNKGKSFIVISSDREIVRAAWSSSSVPVSSEDFLKRLDMALTTDFDYENGEQQYDIITGRLSKKQKAIVRALKKL